MLASLTDLSTLTADRIAIRTVDIRERVGRATVTVDGGDLDVEFAYTVSREVTSMTIRDPHGSLRLVVAYQGLLREPGLVRLATLLAEQLPPTAR